MWNSVWEKCSNCNQVTFLYGDSFRKCLWWNVKDEDAMVLTPKISPSIVSIQIAFYTNLALEYVCFSHASSMLYMWLLWKLPGTGLSMANLYGFSFDLNLGQLPSQLYKPVQVRLAFWDLQPIKWVHSKSPWLGNVLSSKEPSDYFQAAIPTQ